MSERRVLLLLYTASGAAALVYEVTWTRMLTLQLIAKRITPNVRVIPQTHKLFGAL